MSDDLTSRELPYAFHEAGHAVVRLELNRDVLFIELGGKGDEAGQCVSYGGPRACYNEEDPLAAARSEIITNYAGLAAQRLADPSAVDGCADHDVPMRDEIASEFGIKDPELDVLNQNASELVVRLEEAIIEVAQVLIVKRHSTGREIYDSVCPFGLVNDIVELQREFERARSSPPANDSADGN